MQLLPLSIGTLQPGDDLAARILATALPLPGDILVLSSKAVAVCEGSTVVLSTSEYSPAALDYAKKTGRSPAFMEAVLGELHRLHGTVLNTCPGALLTEVRPEGLLEGTILTANAGMDESNTPQGTAVGWPKDPAASARHFWLHLGLPVVISDSCCSPRRLGVTAFALACAGMDPFRSEIGSKDLFGNTLQVTVEATVDQLCTAANMVMGNAAQGVPAVLVRGHGIPPSDFFGWVKGIEPECDMFGKT